jgi:hypothetical protein
VNRPAARQNTHSFGANLFEADAQTRRHRTKDNAMKLSALVATLALLSLPFAAGCAVAEGGDGTEADQSQSELGYAAPAAPECGEKTKLTRALIERCVTRPSELTAAGGPAKAPVCTGTACSCSGVADCLALGGSYTCTSTTCNQAGCIADGCTKNKP